MRNKLFLLIIIVLGSFIVKGQDEQKSQRFIRRGLFRSMGTISSGIMFEQGVTNIYLHGTSEYYVSDNVSIRGDVFWFVNTMNDAKPFYFHHAIFSGASFHFPSKGHFDPYIGIEPGVSITRAKPCSDICLQYLVDPPRQAADALTSAHIGFNLYFQRWFHFFMETRYIYGKHFYNYSPQLLSELRFSFGLGWNLNFIKKK